MIKSTNNINRNTPIIAVTAYERTLQLASVFDDTLCKPVTREIVSRCIRHLTELQSNNNAIHWSSSTGGSASTHQPQQHPIESLFPLSTSSSPVNVKDSFSYPHHQHHQTVIPPPPSSTLHHLPHPASSKRPSSDATSAPLVLLD